MLRVSTEPLNGQSHAEFSKILINKTADLPFITQRLIGHIDCNKLSSQAKRALFVSNREDARSGVLYDLIQQEFVKALKSDDVLTLLNNEARNENYHERDENAVQQMRKEVASILKIQGFEITSAIGATKKGEKLSGEKISTPGTHTGYPKKIIDLKEPPTYIKILWSEDEEIAFYPGQRRHIRVETDANSTYHDPNNIEKSKINIINFPGLVNSCGSTPLQGGRMRIIYECPSDSIIGSKGTIRIELRRSGLPTLSDEHPVVIIEPPSAADNCKQLSLPPFEVNPVSPEDDLWETLYWPSDENEIASSAIQNDGVLRIYYSTVFPKFAEKLKTFERRNAALAEVFTKKYEVWLAAHSLLLDHDKKNHDAGGTTATAVEDSEQMEILERRERCRIAVMSTIFAEREVAFLNLKSNDEAS